MQWTHRNSDRVLSLMSEEDKGMFKFDLCTIDWEKYIKDFCMGTKLYLLNEEKANLPLARKRLRRYVRGHPSLSTRSSTKHSHLSRV